MRTVKTKKAKEVNWAIPYQTITYDEFIDALKKAEAGPFYSVQESMQHFDKWLKSRKKQ